MSRVFIFLILFMVDRGGRPTILKIEVEMLKNILKITAVLILTGGIVAVSVMKSSISAKKQTAELDKIKEQYYAERDSLYLSQLDDSTKFYVDSILKVELFYSKQIDSLNSHFDSLLLAKEQAQKELAAQKNGSAKPKAKPAVKDSISEAIRQTYKKKVGNLPVDLTQYEKRVSVKEIVVGLSQEFKISPDSVNKIVKQ